MPRVKRTLSHLIASQIVDHARIRRWPVGQHLRETALAVEFNVSRSPIRAALGELARIGVAERRANRGYFLRLAREDLTAAGQSLRQRDQTSPYLRIAADRLNGNLPDNVTERLMRGRYGLGRVELAKVLTRMEQEGWVTRRPGYGWTFLPVLISLQSHDQSFRYRLAIEPAALLEPTFRIDHAVFARCRDQQMELVNGRIHEVTSAELFEAGSFLHEALVGCSNNPFFIDSLKRVNRLRRLIEYRAMVDTAQFLDQAREHLQLLDLIEEGDREGAAELLRRHLDAVQKVKLRSLVSDRAPSKRPPSQDAAVEDIALVHF